MRLSSIRSTRLIRGALGIAIFIALAEGAARAGLISEKLLPPMSDVLVEGAKLMGDGEFLRGLGATLTAWVLGLAIVVVVGVPLGVLLGSVTPVNDSVKAIIEFLRPIPSVALIPLAIIIAGPDLGMKTTVIVYAAAWPVLINTMYGMRDVDPVAKETLRSFGFGRLSILYRVALPSATPFIATGVRLASSIGLILAVSAELLAGGSHGLGVFISRSSSGANTLDITLGAALWTGVLGLLANSGLAGLERRLFRWHSVRTEART